MTKNEKLGRILTSLTTVKSEHLGVLVSICNKLSAEGLSGDYVHDRLVELDREKFSMTEEESLFDWKGKVIIPATTKDFISRKKFIKGSKKVKFHGIWDNFMNWFLKGGGTVDEPADALELRYADLMQSSVDDPIIEELGGKTEVRTTLSQIHSLLLKQPQGKKEGVLLTNGYANIFYVKDLEGELRAVYVLWRGGGWGVNAVSVEYPDGWYAGDRVFSSILEA